MWFARNKRVLVLCFAFYLFFDLIAGLVMQHFEVVILSVVSLSGGWGVWWEWGFFFFLLSFFKD